MRWEVILILSLWFIGRRIRKFVKLIAKSIQFVGLMGLLVGIITTPHLLLISHNETNV
jgi:hypothetical protein